MKVNYQNKMVRETPCFWKASMMAGELERSWKQRVLHAALETGQSRKLQAMVLSYLLSSPSWMAFPKCT